MGGLRGKEADKERGRGLVKGGRGKGKRKRQGKV